VVVGGLAGLGASVSGLVVLGGCGALLDQARSARVARLGFLAQEAVPPARLEAFRAGLQERGWTEGQK
jgi:hypothetical protein